MIAQSLGSDCILGEFQAGLGLRIRSSLKLTLSEGLELYFQVVGAIKDKHMGNFNFR